MTVASQVTSYTLSRISFDLIGHSENQKGEQYFH